MIKTEDIDLILTLKPHGWASCIFVLENEKIELDITFSFGDPFVDLIKSLIEILDNNNETQFCWYSEPGGNRINIFKILDQQHIVKLAMQSFDDFIDKKEINFENILTFEIKIKHLIVLFYIQLKKIELLMKDKEYASKRENCFPFELFYEFERKVNLITQ